MADILDKITESGDFHEKRKEHVYADGYDITGSVETFNVDPDATEDSTAIYGRDDNVASTKVTGSTVTLTVFEQNDKVSGLYALLNGLKPVRDPSNSIQQLKWSANMKPTNLLVHRYSNDNSEIVESRFIPGWQSKPAYPAGAADAKAMRSFSGKASIPREFGTYCTAELQARDTHLTYTTPYAVPNMSTTNIYAVHIVALNAPGNDLASDSLQREDIASPTSGMLNSAGTIGWQEIADNVNLTGLTHAHVYYLRSGMTSTPLTDASIAPEGMRGAIT